MLGGRPPKFAARLGVRRPLGAFGLEKRALALNASGTPPTSTQGEVEAKERWAFLMPNASGP
jgi:hypothetical protein